MAHYPLDYAKQEMSKCRKEQGGAYDEGGGGNAFEHLRPLPEEFGTQKEKTHSSDYGGRTSKDYSMKRMDSPEMIEQMDRNDKARQADY